MSEELNVKRFPTSSNRSLKAWSAADEHILKLVNEDDNYPSSTSIINDRFGFLSLHLRSCKPNIISHFKSQEDAVISNFGLNELEVRQIHFSNLIEAKSERYNLILMKIPKSMDLFHLFLIKAHSMANTNVKVYCGFMTRHFTKQMLDLASLYFEDVDQSLAWKKSRVLTLSTPKTQIKEIVPIHDIPYLSHRDENLLFKQYYGVFSAKHIDYATQFLLKYLKVEGSVKTALDLACGNGVIAHEIRSQSNTAEIHLLDDSYLAIESSKLNVTEGNNHFHYNYNLDDFDDDCFDLVVCNPPFHFEHENTIDIAMQLFEGVGRVLNANGRFILVANLHLNYKTHLSRYFGKTEVIAMNSKFEVIECRVVK